MATLIELYQRVYKIKCAGRLFPLSVRRAQRARQASCTPYAEGYRLLRAVAVSLSARLKTHTQTVHQIMGILRAIETVADVEE